jgi:hypothetical protein
MSVAVEGHVRVGFRRTQTTIKVQVPLEERTGASTVDVRVQSEERYTGESSRSRERTCTSPGPHSGTSSAPLSKPRDRLVIDC